MPLVLAAILALTLLALLVYGSSVASRRRIVHVYETLAARWKGHVAEGSFYRPPTLHYEVAGTRAELSAFYLRGGTFSGWLSRSLARLGRSRARVDHALPPHGSRPGHYTQVRYHLDRRVIESFIITAEGTSPSGYRIESLRPELPRLLLERGWATTLRAIEAIRDGGAAQVRFDGDTLTVRKGALLMALANVEAFTAACERLVTTLGEALGDRGIRPRGDDPGRDA